MVAILFGAWLSYASGLVVLALAAYVVPYVYRPNFTWNKADPLVVGVLALLSIIVSWVGGRRRAAEGVLRDVNAELDQRVKQQTRNLKAVNRALRHRLAELESLYGTLPAGICFLDRQLRFVRINDKMAALTGAAARAHLGQSVRSMFPAGVADWLEPLFHRVLETGEEVAWREIDIPPASDQTGGRHWALACTLVRAEDNAALGLQVMIHDITERKTIELELAEANAALRAANHALSRANEDLGQFAYIAAHDLQEPLRNVVTLSQVVERRLAGNLDAQTEQHLRYLVKAGRRMSHLITDLLSYSQLAFGEPMREAPVDLNDIMRALMEEQAQAIRDSAGVSNGARCRASAGAMPTYTSFSGTWSITPSSTAGPTLRPTSAWTPTAAAAKG
jgi:PAS domain S-box-containing protein